MVELDHVTAGSERQAHHPEGVGSDAHRVPVDRGMPAAVEGLAHHEPAARRSRLEPPAAEAAGDARRRFPLCHGGDVALERESIDAIRGCAELHGRHHDRMRVAHERDLVDANAALVENDRERAVELRRIREIPVDLGRRRRRDHQIAHREGL